MKRVFGSSFANLDYTIFSHGKIFYVRKCSDIQKSFDYKDPSNILVLKSDNEKLCRAYIEGVFDGVSIGNKNYFDKYMNLKQKLQKYEAVQ